MEPISLAVLTAAATTLGTKVLEGAGEEAGKSLWEKVKSKLGWKSDPAPADLAPKLARDLNADEDRARAVLELLKSNNAGGAGMVQQLVGQIQTQGGKVVVIGSQTAAGDINNTF